MPDFIPPKEAGIYKLTCGVNNKIYIGKANNIYNRLKVYPRCKNGIGNYLKSAIKKYGWELFDVEILEIVENFDKLKDNDSLLERESHYIKIYNATNSEIGYNICKYSNDNTGMKMSDEAKEKIRAANLGKKWSDATRTKTKNKKLSAEHKKKIGDAHRGMKRSEETKEKIRVANSKPKTTPVSDEHRKNLSKAGRGRVLSEEHKEKLRISAKKRGISKETREKMRISALNRKLKITYD